MYVNNLRIYARHLRRDLVDNPQGLPEPAHTRLLLQGANGSGKSTILETIARLWQLFGRCIEAGAGKSRSVRTGRDYLDQADFAAVEIVGLLPGNQSLWIGTGAAEYWVELKDRHPKSEFAGVVYGKSIGGRVISEVRLPPGDWRSYRDRSVVGSEPQPNVLYFGPDGRTIRDMSATTAPRLLDFLRYRWLARYSSQVDLESFLLTLKAHSESKFTASLDLVNRALDNQNKSVVFEDRGFLVVGKTTFGKAYEHRISQLSSGEKQMLLLLTFVAATLREGGIVIIDEPDLHIHQTMVRQVLASVEALLKPGKGQLIVAGHSEDLWNWFSLDSEKVDLAPWRRST